MNIEAGGRAGGSPSQGIQLGIAERLGCPRCGPAFPLILLARNASAQRVREGEFGCPNCRNRYPVSAGVADLRQTGEGERAGAGASTREEKPGVFLAPEAVAALLGVVEGPGRILLLGTAVRWASWLAGRLEGVDVAGVVLREEDLPQEASGVSWMLAGRVLPFQAAGFHAVAASGSPGRDWLPQLPSLIRTGGRLVVPDPRPDEGERLREMGLALLLRDPRAVVGVRG